MMACSPHICMPMACLAAASRALLALAMLLAGVVARPAHSAEPLSAAEAIHDFAVPEGFRIELVAAEPQIVDPVAMAIDHLGRLWVVEMRDYPFLADGESPSSRIRILEDADQDGFFETASTFVDGLLFPTGLQLWKSGAFVTLAGELAYFPDEDHDGRADCKEIWYRGFATPNEQLRANHPTLAPEGWIYVAGGLRGGLIHNLHRIDQMPISISGRDFAFNPATGDFRTASGNGQFGLTMNDYGRRFTCSNRNPLIEVMIEQRYLDCNRKLVPPRVVHDVAAAGADSRIYPRSRAITTSARHAGQFTAACGAEVYRGDAFPSALYGDAFICEPTANLIHREVLAPRGSAFHATPADAETEFLTAADEWFRPVNLAKGPDGALYVVDMYRAVIEHPEWMPPELRQRPDLRYGIDRGRIYRITAEGHAVPGRSASAVREAFSTDDPDRLARLLSHPNSWHRETAARRLLEMGDNTVIGPLSQIARDSDFPPARYLALSTLYALSAFTPELARAALRDPAPEIRAAGLIFAESYLSEPSDLVDEVIALASDADARVRYQAALTSMFLPIAQSLPALRSIAQQDRDDAWTCRAVALAARNQAATLLSDLLFVQKSEVSELLVRELLAAVIAHDEGPQVANFLAHISELDATNARMILLAASEALQQRGISLTTVLQAVSEESPNAYRDIVSLFDAALDCLTDAKQPDAVRIGEATLLQFDVRPTTASSILELLTSDCSPQLQIAATGFLAAQSSPETADALLMLYEGQLPMVRRATVDLLSSRPQWIKKLLNAIEANIIDASTMDPTHRLLLMQHNDPELRRRASLLFASRINNRGEVILRFRPALDLTGDPTRGHAVFAANCAGCHRIGAEGIAIGPDIGDSAMKSSEQLLTDILDPNRVVDANFVNYVVVTVSGVGHQGIITEESASGLVLLGADGKKVTILREEIESLTSGASLMPEGLEQLIDLQQMADLITFLKTWRHADELQVKQVDPPSGASTQAQ